MKIAAVVLSVVLALKSVFDAVAGFYELTLGEEETSEFVDAAFAFWPYDGLISLLLSLVLATLIAAPVIRGVLAKRSADWIAVGALILSLILTLKIATDTAVGFMFEFDVGTDNRVVDLYLSMFPYDVTLSAFGYLIVAILIGMARARTTPPSLPASEGG